MYGERALKVRDMVQKVQQSGKVGDGSWIFFYTLFRNFIRTMT